MKKAWLIIIPILAILYFASISGSSSDNYPEEIAKFWNDRHDFFLTSSVSPFIQKNATYHPVQLFEVDKSYRVKATLNRFTKRETITLKNSDGTATTYLKYANASFKLSNKNHSLLILKTVGFGNQYFLAFGDETSGGATYGGGRYLDVSIGKSNELILDFNKAYNPYCAYFDDFTCPLPPLENLLEVSIMAGEKNYTY
ncbi:MAG: DUF1684 domain-containing protein [Bacteroidota bacterium]